ncbi:MAG TPA: polyprenol monophosphomannose synthase [Thermoplasmata archaeon]|nr:polyprenol monophosphomannose synthase [Thermoplasmata archaeon]
MSEPLEVSVVVPTLNERESIALLAPRIDAALRQYRYEVVVVDDDSSDGTAEEVQRVAARHPWRLYVRRGERGLASAVVRGMQIASGRVIAGIDADGSHPPELLPSMIQPILAGSAEMTIASRNVPGGASPGLSGSRRVISWGAGVLARPLTRVKDPMSGYFAVDRDVLGRGALEPVGYKIVLEILVKCRPSPAVEVPFVFAARSAGASKLGSGEIGRYIRHVGRLYAWSIAGRRRASMTR